VPPERVVLVGARDFEPTEEERLARSSITRADTGSLSAALDALAEHTEAVYVHIDLDVLDPSEGRANGWAVGGGLSADELDAALRAITSRFEIAAAAFTAYDPACDEEGRIPRIAARVAPRLLRAGVAS
jgi:arginase